MYVRDINGDSEADVVIGTTSSQGNHNAYRVYVWDESTGGYREMHDLAGVPNLSFSLSNSIVTGLWLNTSAQRGWALKAKIVGSKLDTVETLTIENVDSLSQKLIREYNWGKYQLFDEGP